jgi:hypothetical protein
MLITESIATGIIITPPFIINCNNDNESSFGTAFATVSATVATVCKKIFANISV